MGVCDNDPYATEAGLDVPGDISLVRAHDRDIAQQIEIPLTTTAQPRRAVSQQAIRLVLRLIDGVWPLPRGSHAVQAICSLK